MADTEKRKRAAFREKLWEIIFEADTFGGKAFDVTLLVLIVVSVLAVVVESVQSIHTKYGDILLWLEWSITILFTIEYLLRIAVSRHAGKYVFSFFGIVDLLSILPTYLSLLIPGTQSLLVIRALRLIRVFRVLKMVQFVREAKALKSALRASLRKIAVFLLFVLSVALIVGSLMYLIEGEANGFTNIPISLYWTIVTMTTVGYGDIAPQTVLGKMLASIVMILGYAIIAVPTGIVAVEVAATRKVSTQVCPECQHEGHDTDAMHCKYCGAKI